MERITSANKNNSIKNQPEVPSKPRVRFSANREIYEQTKEIVRSNKLNTICEEGNCPNVFECWSKKHASFIILGSVCTRKCAFCNVATGIPSVVDPNEPMRVALAVSAMQLKHVVVTSVDRDDLEDGGAEQFSKTIKFIRNFCPDTTVEVLTPDFLGKKEGLDIVINAKPDVFNHNIETVPSLYLSIRPKARYFHSINILKTVKEKDPSIFTKSGIMLGLGEKKEEVLQVMDDLRVADVDFITIGQYLQPTKKHAEVKKYATEEEFEFFKKRGYKKGFKMVASSSLVSLQ